MKQIFIGLAWCCIPVVIIWACIVDSREAAKYPIKIETTGSNREEYHAKEYEYAAPGCVTFYSREAGRVTLCGNYKITQSE